MDPCPEASSPAPSLCAPCGPPPDRTPSDRSSPPGRSPSDRPFSYRSLSSSDANVNPVRPALQGPEGFGGDGVEGADGGEGGNKAATRRRQGGEGGDGGEGGERGDGGEDTAIILHLLVNGRYPDPRCLYRSCARCSSTFVYFDRRSVIGVRDPPNRNYSCDLCRSPYHSPSSGV
jgi:hypothetical protein